MAETPPRLNLQLTKTAATFVVGFVLYNLFKKFNNPNPNVIIQSLHIYPVKSCKGFEVVSWPISKYGLKYDREWMIYNPKTNRFVTQRTMHILALVKVELIMNGMDDKFVNGIKLSAPNIESILVPIEKDESNLHKVENVILWKDKVSGIDQGDNIAKWLTKYINNGCEYRLLRISNNYKRKTNAKYTPEFLRGQSNATYADGYPYLIASQSSLNAVNYELNKRGFNEIPMNRFRPNIVIVTDLNEPFIEDRIAKLKFNHNKKNQKINDELITFYLTHPCSRCQLPTVNQNSAIPNKNHEPTLTLRTFRTGKHLGFDKNTDEKVYFGMNAVHDRFDENITISKGDSMLPFFR